MHTGIDCPKPGSPLPMLVHRQILHPDVVSSDSEVFSLSKGLLVRLQRCAFLEDMVFSSSEIVFEIISNEHIYKYTCLENYTNIMTMCDRYKM